MPLAQFGFLLPQDVREEHGFQTAIEAPAVLLGQSFTRRVPGAFFEVPVTVAFVFGSDPTVVNRLARLEVLDGDNNRVTTIPGESIQGAGQIRLYTWTLAMTGFANPGGSSSIGPLFPMVLPSGWALRLTADNLQANDTISAVSIVLQQYITGIELERVTGPAVAPVGNLGLVTASGFSTPTPAPVALPGGDVGSTGPPAPAPTAPASVPTAYEPLTAPRPSVTVIPAPSAPSPASAPSPSSAGQGGGVSRE